MALQPELVCPVSVESEVANCWFPLLEAAEHREHSEWLSLLLCGVGLDVSQKGMLVCCCALRISCACIICVVLCRSRLISVVSTAVGTDGCLPGLVLATHCVWLVQCTGVGWFPYPGGLGSTTACVGPCLVHC